MLHTELHKWAITLNVQKVQNNDNNPINMGATSNQKKKQVHQSV